MLSWKQPWPPVSAWHCGATGDEEEAPDLLWKGPAAFASKRREVGKAPPTQTAEAEGSPPPTAQASTLEGQKQLRKQQQPPDSESPTSRSLSL